LPRTRTSSLTRDPRWAGISRHGSGWRAAVSRGKHKPKVYAYFPAETAPEVMQEWRRDAQANLRITRKRRASQGTFEGDARRYLRAVKALPTYDTREQMIELWIGVFGTTRREDITAADIREQRDKWLTEPRDSKHPRGRGTPVSPHTVNLRLRALSNLWTVLDGRRAPNPVREVPEAMEPTPRPRAIPAETIARILAAIPDRGKREKGSNPKRAGDPGSLSKVRLRILAETGWPAGTLMRMTPDRIDWQAKTADVPDRHKGQGAAALTMPLTDAALEALTDLKRRQGFGRFSTSSLAKTFKRACTSLGLAGIRVYDLRHSFGTRVAVASGDERAVQILMQHRDIRTTRIYTEASIDPRVRSAFAAMGRLYGTTGDREMPESGGKSQVSGTTRTAQKSVGKGRK
jgi:integrase